MKFIIGIIAVALLSFLAQQVFPWWIIVAITLLVGGFLGMSSGKSFLFGFLGIALMWGIHAFLINQANDGLLASKIGELLGGLSSGLVVLISAALGGLIGGLGAMTGSLGRGLIK